MQMKAAIFQCCVLVVALQGASVAQTTLHTTTTLVVVPTLVQTTGKEPVASLTAADFVLTDNGVPQKVTLEEETKRPLSLVVLMQTGGVARGQFASYVNLETMLASLLGGAPNRVSIVNFDSRPEAASPFTTNVAEWREAIDHPDQGDSGAAIFDGISFALLKKEPVGNRRAILLISQEHDNGSKTQMKEIVRELGETNTAIYSVTFSAEKAEAKLAFTEPAHESAASGYRAKLCQVGCAVAAHLWGDAEELVCGGGESFRRRIDELRRPRLVGGGYECSQQPHSQ